MARFRIDLTNLRTIARLLKQGRSKGRNEADNATFPDAIRQLPPSVAYPGRSDGEGFRVQRYALGNRLEAVIHASKELLLFNGEQSNEVTAGLLLSRPRI